MEYADNTSEFFIKRYFLKKYKKNRFFQKILIFLQNFKDITEFFNPRAEKHKFS